MTAEIFALGSALVSGAGEAVPGSRTFSRVVSARRRNQHARRVRYPIPGGKGIRTPDFQLAKLALYQLSYAPREKSESVGH